MRSRRNSRRAVFSGRDIRSALTLVALLLGVSLGSVGQSVAQSRATFTQPTCRTYAYSTPVPNASGVEQRSETLGGLFCTARDFPASFDSLSGEVGKDIASRLLNNSNNPITRVRIADYIFSDDRVARYLCEQLSVSSFELDIYSQSRASAGSRIGVYPSVEAILKDCFRDKVNIYALGCDVFGASCSISGINTFHLKLIEVERSSGRVDQIESSGNIGRGMYSNLEDWVFFDDVGVDNVHSCLWRFLEKAALGELNTDVNSSVCEEIAEGGELEFILLPFNSEKYYNKFYTLAVDASEIFVVSMDFTDRRMQGALKTALRKGANVTFVASSDWYYAHILKKDQGNAIVNDIALPMELRKDFPGQVNLLFAETNYYVGFGNTLHHKFAVFRSNGINTALAGTTNMKRGAITRNLDQAYVFRGAVANQYSAYIDWLQPRVLTYDKMPSDRPTIILPAE